MIKTCYCSVQWSLLAFVWFACDLLIHDVDSMALEIELGFDVLI